MNSYAEIILCGFSLLILIVYDKRLAWISVGGKVYFYMN